MIYYFKKWYRPVYVQIGRTALVRSNSKLFSKLNNPSIEFSYNYLAFGCNFSKDLD